MTPVMKLAAGPLAQAASEFLVQVAGPAGASLADMDIHGEAVNPAEDLFEMRRVTVGGGANEIQRGILAKRTLDLPS